MSFKRLLIGGAMLVVGLSFGISLLIPKLLVHWMIPILFLLLAGCGIILMFSGLYKEGLI